jgi:hypothetical protein
LKVQFANGADQFLDFISSPQDKGIGPDGKKLSVKVRGGTHANDKGIGLSTPDLGRSLNPAHFPPKVVIDNKHIVVQRGCQGALTAGKLYNLSPQPAG